MKKYLIGECRATNKVVLIAFESKDSWNGRDQNDPSVYLTHQQMLNIATHDQVGIFSAWFDCTRKADCLRIIKRDFPGCELMDYSGYIFTRGYQWNPR